MTTASRHRPRRRPRADKVRAQLLELYPTDGGEVGEDGEPMLDPINARDKYGWTPLHHACYAGHADCAEALIGKGADVAKAPRRGPPRCTPRWSVATSPRFKRSSQQQGGDELVGAVCSLGRTALNMAEAKGYPQIAALLRGEDPSTVEPAPAGAPLAGHHRPGRVLLHHTCGPIPRSSNNVPPEGNRSETLMHKKRGEAFFASEFSCVEVVSEVRPATMADAQGSRNIPERSWARSSDMRTYPRMADTPSPNGARDTIDGDTEVCRDSLQAALSAAGCRC